MTARGAGGGSARLEEAAAPLVDPMDWRERIRSAVRLLPPSSAVELLGRGEDDLLQKESIMLHRLP